MPTLSFREFLMEIQQQQEQQQEGATEGTTIGGTGVSSVCIGNPAGDADSIVSSLGLAYVHHLLQHPKQMTPLVSIPRADMALRRETVLLLEMAGIKDTSRLQFIDDDPYERTIPTTATDVTLLDHNRLVDSYVLERTNLTVVEIVDHHMDEGHHLNVADDARVIAFEDGKATVASTCTLVAERLLTSSSSSRRGQHDVVTPTTTTVPTDLAIALIGVILLDSVNQSPSAGKVTPRDTAAIRALVEKADWSLLEDKSFVVVDNNDGISTAESAKTPTLDLDKLYNFLSSSKFDPSFWKSLSVTDALRLDYKKFQAAGGGDGVVFGASSVLLPLNEFLEKPDLSKQVQDYMSAQEISLLLVMSMTMINNVPSRSMAIFGTSNNDNDDDKGSVSDRVTDFLLNDETAATLQSTETKLPIGNSDGLTVRTLHQGNPKASRKQVVPILLEFLQREVTTI